MKKETFSIEKSIRDAEEFYTELERLVKRYNPIDFGFVISGIIKDVLDNQGKQRFYPIHFLVHSIEANCAYHRSYFNDQLILRKIDQIFNFYDKKFVFRINWNEFDSSEGSSWSRVRSKKSCSESLITGFTRISVASSRGGIFPEY